MNTKFVSNYIIKGLLISLLVTTLGCTSSGTSAVDSLFGNFSSAPILTSIPDQTLAQEDTLALDINNIKDGVPGSDSSMSYTCSYDLVDDDIVDGTQNCTGLSGLSFDPATGIFSWTPTTSILGNHEFKITGKNGDGQYDEIFTIAVRLKFSGISSYTAITGTGVTVNWTPNPAATGYQIFKLNSVSSQYELFRTVTGGATSGATITGLTPNTPYTLRAQAVDTLGGLDGNVVSRSFTTTELVKLAMTPVTASATAGTPVAITVRAYNADSSPQTIGGLPLTPQIASGTSSGNFSAVTDNNDGTYSFTFTPTIVGTSLDIDVTTNTTFFLQNMSTLTINPGPASSANSNLTIASSSIVSGFGSTVTATLRDAYNNPISSGITVAFAKTGGTSTGTFSAINNIGAGVYTTTYTGVLAGTAQSLFVSSNGVTLTPTTTVQVVPGAAFSANSSLAISSNSIASGTAATLTATLKDINNNPIPSGILVSFNKAGGTSSGSFSGVTNAGSGSYTATYTGVTAGTAQTLTVVVDGVTLTPTQSITVTPGPAVLANSSLTISSSTVTSGAFVTATATLRDANNNPIESGITVSFSKTGGTSTGTFNSVSNQGNGAYNIRYTGVTAGTAQTLRVLIDNVDLGATQTISVVPGAPSSTLSTINVSQSSVLSGSSVTVTTVIRDDNSNPISSGVLVTFAKSGGTSTGNFTSVTNAGSGSYTTTYEGVNAGTAQSLGVLVDGITLGPTTSILVLPGAPSNGLSTLSISASTVIAAQQVTLTATIKDAQANPISSGIVVAFDKFGGSSTGTFSAVTNQGNGVYTATYTGNVAGSPQTVQANVNGTGFGPTQSIQVLVGAPSAGHSSLTITTSPLSSGATANIAALIRDVKDNPITSEYAISFDAIGGSSTGNLSATSNMGTGNFTATYEGVVAGSAQTVRVLADGSPISGLTASLQVIPGTVNTTNSSFTVGSSTVQSGTSTSFAVSLRDVNNNAIASGATITFNKTAGVSNGNIAAVTNLTNGNYSSTYTASTMGSAQTITLVVNGTAYPSLNNNITVTAGPPSQLAVSGPLNPLMSLDCAGPYTITLKDNANNTTVSNSGVSFSISSLPLNSHTGTLFTDSSCNNGLSSLSIPIGVPTTQFYYRSYVPQTTLITLTPDGGISSSDLTIQNIPVLSYVGTTAAPTTHGSGSGTVIDNKGGGMWNPYGVHRSDDYLFVADLTGNRVLKYTFASGNWTYQGWIGQIASKEGLSVACASANLGDFTPTWCTGGRSESVSATNALMRDPRAVTADSTYIYVTGTHRVMRFRIDTGAYAGWIGRITGTIPPLAGQLATCPSPAINSPTPGWCLGGTWTSGTGSSEFNGPTDLAVLNGKLYVLDTGNNRLQKIDATNGTFEGWVGRINGIPTSPSACTSPNVASGDATPTWCFGGTAQASDRYNLACCSPSPETAAPPEGFNTPIGIDLDTSYIYIADYTNRRIVRLNTTTGAFSGWIGRVKRGTNLSPTSPAQADTSYVSTWTSGGTTQENTGVVGFASVTSVKKDGTYLYLTDASHRVIRVDAADGQNFRWIGRAVTSPTGGFTGCSSTPVSGVTPGWCMGGAGNRVGNTNGAFYTPYSVDSDSDNLYIADLNNFRVQKITKATGEFAGWIGAGLQATSQWTRTAPTQFARSGIDDYSFGEMTTYWAGMALNNDYFYTPDPGWHRIKRHNRRTGTIVGYIGTINIFPPTGPDECVGYTSGMTPAWCYGGGRTTSGAGIHGYNNPFSVAADETYLYIANYSNERVDRVRISDAVYMGWIGRVNAVPTDGDPACLTSLTDDPAPNWCIGGTAKQGLANGMLRSPRAVYYDSGISKLFVMDVGRLMRINPSNGQTEAVLGHITGGTSGCTLMSSLAPTGWCNTGTGSTGSTAYGALSAGTGLTTNSTHIYISDVGTNRILKYNKSTGAIEGFIGRMTNATNLNVAAGDACQALAGPYPKPVPGWCKANAIGLGLNTSAGAEQGSFNSPRGVYADSSYVYVADTNNHRLVRINATTGAFAGWKGMIATTAGMSDSDCISAGVGGVTPEWCLGGTAGPSSQLGGFDMPTGIIGDTNYLYVHDGRNNRVVTIPKD